LLRLGCLIKIFATFIFAPILTFFFLVGARSLFYIFRLRCNDERSIVIVFLIFLHMFTVFFRDRWLIIS